MKIVNSYNLLSFLDVQLGSKYAPGKMEIFKMELIIAIVTAQRAILVIPFGDILVGNFRNT